MHQAVDKSRARFHLHTSCMLLQASELPCPQGLQSHYALAMLPRQSRHICQITAAHPHTLRMLLQASEPRQPPHQAAPAPEPEPQAGGYKPTALQHLSTTKFADLPISPMTKK